MVAGEAGAGEKPQALWRIVLGVPAALAPRVADALEEYCASVAWSADEDAPECRVEGLALAEPDQGAIAAALARLGAGTATARTALRPTIHIEPLAPRDWLAENRASFAPVRAGRYFVHGSHFEDDPPRGCVPIEIDAATAFGSGHHASTVGCLEALHGLARRRRFANPLDMGCGSGILAIAMAKTWDAATTAADIDGEAVRVCRANARRNGVAPRVRAVGADGYGRAVIARRAPFDLVTANILANPLCAMAADLAAVLAEDGIAVLSGFMAGDQRRVVAAHRRAGLGVRRRIAIGDWRTLVLRR